ncbi:MAG: protein kinase [Candidatus Latescibacteria bacterium]|nr:protein kinase [Candidatus Latescibacterota bacterium]
MIAKEIGHYQIRRLLGEGGMGEVYKAYDSALDREVALKVLSERLAREKRNRERFYQEARSAASLNHPNVVTIHDVGEKDGVPYFVMEYLQGTVLSRVIKKSAGNRLPTERALDLTRQICQALNAAHRRGILHRDIKPDNVMVAPDGTAKVLDFGIASIARSTTLTKANELLGTVEYMAPEQLLADGVDQRSDIYSLGVVLYEMLTGELPFTGTTPAAILYQQLEEKPTPPGNLNTSIPISVEKIVLKALSKDPNQRYQSASEMLEDIRGILERKPPAEVSAEPIKDETEEFAGEKFGGRDFQPKLVGREKELKYLKTLFNQPQGDRGYTVFLAGEAGIGKTRLADEFLQYATRKGALALSGACLYREGTQPYLPFIDALRGCFDSATKGMSDETREEIKLLIRNEAPELAHVIQRFTASIGRTTKKPELGNVDLNGQTPNSERPLVSSGARTRLFEVISQLLILISEGRPVVLLLDDIHWADSASLTLLHYIARSTASHPLMIITTYRPEELITPEGEKVSPLAETMQRMSREGLYQKIELGGLSKEDLPRIIESIFRRTTFSDDFVDSLYQETEGNPFFIIEVLKLLRDQGVVFESKGVWHTKREITKEDIPERIYDVIVRRIQRLEEDQRELLQLAAVEGEKFTSTVLSNVLNISKIQLLKMIHRLERVYQIIRSEGDNYIFNHTKIREILYAEIPAELRREYHLAVGQCLETEHKSNLDVILDKLANHFYWGEDFNRAFPYLVKSGDRANRLFASKASCTYFEQALDSLEKANQIEAKDKLRKELLYKLGSSYEILGDLDRALESYENCAQLSERLNDLETKAASLRRIGRINRKQGDWDNAMLHFKTSQALYEEMGHKQGIAQVLTDIGTVFAEKGEYTRAVEHFQQALEIAHRAEHNELMASIYTNLGIVYNMKGQRDEAISYCQESISLYESVGDLQGLARVYHNLAMIYGDEKDWHNSEQFYGKSLKIAKKIKDSALTALIYLNKAEVYLNTLELRKAKESCVRAVETFKKSGDRLGTADASKMLGIASKLQGDWESAEFYFKDSISLNEELESPLGLAEVYREYGAMLKEKGELDRARAKFDESRAIFEQIGAEQDLSSIVSTISEIQELEKETKRGVLRS